MSEQVRDEVDTSESKPSTWRVVWLQTFTGGREECAAGLSYQTAVFKTAEFTRLGAGFGGIFFVEEEHGD